ncbi:hypothetical protein GGD54_005849 [Rhizobium tropici]|uniref:Uncharacterized protein n=4 Tax=Rhizobium TaxID=379 RepID=A0A1C3X7T5_9HYPH|nr:hypothetical protein [Rhizobium tropici]MBB4569989.1 hypothetical protein [Rhizobium leucaenae]MBB5576328.1 hypothetical protein [Rhizobium paranaense]MBB6489211.1 hypothetical protein [Rhizobium lusitanum]MBB5596407.1 hypothetical protein [Rhizobium tropici]
MIAVNASTSPHSSVSFTPFGKAALTLAGSGDDLDSRSSPGKAGQPTELLCIGKLCCAALT